MGEALQSRGLSIIDAVAVVLIAAAAAVFLGTLTAVALIAVMAIAAQYAVFRFTRGWPLRRRAAAVLVTMVILIGVFWLLRLAGY